MIIFYYGSDTFTLGRELKSLKDKFAAENPGAGVEEFTVSKDESDAGLTSQLQEVLQSQGLFSRAKLVILKNFLGELKDYPKSEEYLAGFVKTSSKPSPRPSTGVPSPEQGEGNIVVFTQSEKFDRRLKFFKSLQQTAETKEFIIPVGKDLETWVVNYLHSAGFKIENDALKEFARLMSGENEDEQLYDLWQVSSELEKLMLLRTPHPRPLPQGEREAVITLQDVRDLVKPNISQNVFALTNLFAEGKSAEAQRLLEQLVGFGPPGELKSQTIQIIGGLASQIRSLLLVKDLERESPAKIASTLGWKEGRVWINSKLARKFTAQKLASLMRDLRALDLRLKTSEEPPKLLLSLFLLRRSSRSPEPSASGQKARPELVNMKGK